MKTSLIFKPLASVTLATLLTAGFANGEIRVESADLDGDGVANINDPDVDGDGIPNGTDRNVDGGVCRRGPFKGLYVGDRLANDSPRELDIDGDGRNDGAANENDIDGDGIKNKLDKDRDGDGKKDAIDKDDDGDGIPDKKERRPATDASKIIIGSKETVQPPIAEISLEIGVVDTMAIKIVTIDLWLEGRGRITENVELEKRRILEPGSSGSGTLEISADLTLGLGDLDGSVPVVISANDQESTAMIEESFAESDPEAASAWLLSYSESLRGERQFPEGWFQNLLENSSVESLELLDSLARVDPQGGTAWLEKLSDRLSEIPSGDSLERLDFLEKARAESVLRRGRREVFSDVEVREILSENDESLVTE
jgi:hypothetical protein